MISRLKKLLFENSSVKQTVTKNFFWLTFSQIVSRLIRSIIIIYAARKLGAADYGVFAYALGFAALFTTFADIGVSPILTKEAAQKPDKRSSYFSTILSIKSLLLLFTACAVVFVAPLFSKIPQAKILIPFIALLIIFDGLRDICLAFFRALQKMEIEAIITILTNIAITALGFVAISFSASPGSLTFSYVTSSGVGALAAIIILRKEFYSFFSSFDKNLVKPVLYAAIPFALSNIVGVFMTNTDIVMLGWWRTPAEVGYYSAGQRIIQLLYALPSIFAVATFPAFSQLIALKDKDKIRALMEKTVVLGSVLAIPIAIGGIILSSQIITLVYGQSYLPAASSFSILIITVLFLFPGVSITNLFLAYDIQKRLVVYVALASVSNIVLNIFLIPLYGIAGAAFATAVSQIIYFGLGWLNIKNINNFYALHYLKKIALAGVLMGALSFSLKAIGLNVIVNVCLSGLTYLGILIILKEEVLGEIFSLFKRI